MADRRTVTGTKTLQTAWTVLGLVAVGVALAVAPGAVDPVALAVGGGVWLFGLVVMGWRERRAWNRLVARSTFERQSPGSMADLHRVVKGHTVTVATDVPHWRAQAHTLVRTSVEGVDGPVDIRLSRDGEGAEAGIETGNPALDAVWTVRGHPGDVERLLSTDVQAALMDVAVPATLQVSAAAVVLEVPFTRVTPDELAAAAECVATVAERVERLGRGDVSPVA